MLSNLNRREFFRFSGLGAGSAGLLALNGSAGRLSEGLPVFARDFQIGKPLRVKPVLVYEIFERREQTSWRPWGGLHDMTDVQAEEERILKELAGLVEAAEFPLEVLPLARAGSENECALAGEGDHDVLLFYAAMGSNSWLEKLTASGKPAIMFLRHRSGPVYLWYEIAHPRFLRKTADAYGEKNLDVNDIVVDEYADILWRLRALYGLKNTRGTRIVAIGGAGGWGEGSSLAPAISRDLWGLDIREVSYEQLEPLIRKAMGDRKKMSAAERRTDEILSHRDVNLQTDRQFVVNAVLLNDIFRELMQEADAPAITVQGCMSTIIPIARTTACLSLSLINDDGLMAFCESDFVVIPSGILLRYISGRPSFLQDPTHPHHGVVTVAHCTAPRRMNGLDLEPVRILTHYESDYGAAPKVEMKIGQIVTNIAPNFHSTRWIGFTGKIIDHPFMDICRSQIDIEINGDWRRLLDQMQGFHWMTCYGDCLKEVGYAVKKLGIEWVNVSDNSIA